MSEQTFKQEFEGYWRDINKSGIPAQSGVYCVYECKYNLENKTVNIKRLIYIGESENVRERISNHEKYSEWLRYQNVGNTLCFSFTPTISFYRSRIEAAFINHHKPPVNTEYKNHFPFDKTNIETSGNNTLLSSYFSVNTKF